jgi:transposase
MRVEGGRVRRSKQTWQEGHLALFVSDAVDCLDLSGVLESYLKNHDSGRAGYQPTTMVKLLVYGYCFGKLSSRELEKSTYEEVAFRILVDNQHPTHDCIAEFREKNLAMVGALFVRVLLLCRRAGLVGLGDIAIDGMKIESSASQVEATSYERVTEKRLEEKVKNLLEEAARVDAEEDAQEGTSRGE